MLQCTRPRMKELLFNMLNIKRKYSIILLFSIKDAFSNIPEIEMKDNENHPQSIYLMHS